MREESREGSFWIIEISELDTIEESWCAMQSPGKLSVNREPFPSTDSTVMSPPSALPILRLTARPRPTPSLLLPLFCMIFVKGWKSLESWSLLMPRPESSTSISKHRFAFICELILTKPVLVYLIAFDMRLIRICFTLFTSVSMVSGWRLMNESSEIPFSFALKLRASKHSWTNSERLAFSELRTRD